ncbi:MAG: hypothetical protein IPG83_18045 [Novosphingobium sp.]|jgi:hypothetical protein|nr:hypothetical protein [Novosphingobium sp.]
MEIAQYLTDEATSFLRREGDGSLPQKLSGTSFYLAKASDRTIMAFGVVLFEGVEYKLGPMIAAD